MRDKVLFARTWSQFTPQIKEIYEIYTDKKLAKEAVERQNLVHRWMEEWEISEY